MPDEPRLEEQALSAAAQKTIAAQLDGVENIEVAVRTDLLKIIQGQADSASLTAQGMVVQKDIRVQEMELHIQSIAVDLLSAIFGHIELDKPLDAIARLVLTEQDINRALSGDYIRSKFQTLELNLNGEMVTLTPQQLEVHLPEDDKMGFSGTIMLHEMGKTRRVSFNALIRPRTISQPLLLEAFHCTEGDGISLELAVAFLNKAKELVNLPYFEIQGMAFRVKQLDVQKGSLTLHTEAYIKQFPDLNLEE
ncbi:MAG TPA: DUF2993 domain-containing protein [Cyanobacteria bacterium UBA8553]|nr:DUF2993 domain-containing protein [Cyanobacteria bacterium UBA8553]HAJ61359.1 DUF2993 domain-containing protein [Cyanobacteria bacterium UBA8543]